MNNIALKLCFDGTNYSGFQRQENAMAVQNILEDRLSVIFQSKITVTGCSRTDAGVHAREFVCNFRSDSGMDTHKLIKAINGGISKDIVVYEAWNAPGDFHARYSAKGKTYVYSIWNKQLHDPFTMRYSYHVSTPLDVDKMNRVAARLIGRHDFAAFACASDEEINTVREITECKVKRTGGMVTIEVTAPSFLYKMVRTIAGTLINAGLNKTNEEEIAGIINSRDRAKAGPTAPAKGLCLMKVYY